MNRGTLKILYLAKNISVLFVPRQKMERAKCLKSRVYKAPKGIYTPLASEGGI